MLSVLELRQLGRYVLFVNAVVTVVLRNIYVIHDQIVIKTTNENIHKKAMTKNWELNKLHQKGMKYESGAAGEEKISSCELDKVGAFSYQRIKNEKNKTPHK